MNKFLIGTAILVLCCSTGEAGFASGTKNGPADITLQTIVNAQKTPRPAFFPHFKHQELTGCETCHHGKGPDGKQKAFIKGQKIEKCETCHNDKTGMPEKLANLKRVGHTLCMNCHLENNQELIKCGACHTKK